MEVKTSFPIIYDQFLLNNNIGLKLQPERSFVTAPPGGYMVFYDDESAMVSNYYDALIVKDNNGTRIIDPPRYLKKYDPVLKARYEILKRRLLISEVALEQNEKKLIPDPYVRVQCLKCVAEASRLLRDFETENPELIQ